MLGELGRRGDAALARGADAAQEAAHATTLYLRRIVGAVSTALARVTQESRDLVWNYQDVAAELRRRGGDHVPTRPRELPERSGRPALRVLRPEE